MKSSRRIAHRLIDILEAIAGLRLAVQGETFETFQNHPIRRPAAERFLEIISEASRHVPEEVKTSCETVPWRKIAALGNILRHAYHDTDPAIIWDIHQNHLDELERVIRRIQPAYPDVADS